MLSTVVDDHRTEYSLYCIGDVQDSQNVSIIQNLN